MSDHIQLSDPTNFNVCRRRSLCNANSVVASKHKCREGWVKRWMDPCAAESPKDGLFVFKNVGVRVLADGDVVIAF